MFVDSVANIEDWKVKGRLNTFGLFMMEMCFEARNDALQVSSLNGFAFEAYR
jgi:hypothetical protein